MINQIYKEGKRQQLEAEGQLVSNIDEQRVNGLTVKIDRDLCVGFGDCIDPVSYTHLTLPTTPYV